MAAILEGKNISKGYGRFWNRKQVLDDCSCSFNKGTFYSIIGRSGSGKSTLIKILAGMLRPDSGSVLMAGQNVGQLSEEQSEHLRKFHFGYVPQFYTLIESLSVQENLMLPADFNGLAIDEFYLKKLIESLELEDLLDRFPDQLSLGEKQRVALARALCLKPDILLLDEPTGNLDRQSVANIIELLRYVQRVYDVCIIMVSHDLDLAKHADEILVLEEGKLKEYGV